MSPTDECKMIVQAECAVKALNAVVEPFAMHEKEDQAHLEKKVFEGMLELWLTHGPAVTQAVELANKYHQRLDELAMMIGDLDKKSQEAFPQIDD